MRCLNLNLSQKFLVPLKFHIRSLQGRSTFLKAKSVNVISKSTLPRLTLLMTGGIFGGVILYDGCKNEFKYLGSTERFLRSLKVAASIAVNYLWVLNKYKDRNDDDIEYGEAIRKVNLKCANKILEACLKNGGLYIKIGQGVSAINHILPEEYISTLSNLQDKCLPSTRIDVIKVFQEDFGKLPEEIFQEFNYKPIAAASLAQVFRARLHNGKEVAVKVQYPDLQRRFFSDIGTIIFLQNIIEVFFKNYNFGWILYYLRDNLKKELDFIEEGKNAEECARDLKKYKYAYVPKIYWNYTTTRVITEEWIDGCKISDLDCIKESQINLKDLDTKLISIFSEQIFRSGFVHADPHPGNVFCRKLPNGSTQIILLDHGLYERISCKVRKPLCHFWEAAILKDEEGMKKAAELLNMKHPIHFAEVLFQMPFDTNLGLLKSRLSDEDIEKMQEIAKKNFDRIMQTLKEMPINMLLVIRNLNTIRAVTRQHGDPADRLKLMARFAHNCMYEKGNFFVSKVRTIYKKIHFEYCLLKMQLKMKIIKLYFDILYKIGRSPKDSSIFEGNLQKL